MGAACGCLWGLGREVTARRPSAPPTRALRWAGRGTTQLTMNASDPTGDNSPGEFRSIAFGNQRSQAQDPDDCHHPQPERVGRVRAGIAHVDLDCTDCGETVARDIRGRTVDRGRGLATDGGEASVEEIDTTQDTGLPVFEVTVGDGKANVILQDGTMFVPYVSAHGDAGLSDVMDHASETFDPDRVKFTCVISERLDDALDGFEETWEEHEATGEEVRCLVGEWEADHATATEAQADD